MFKPQFAKLVQNGTKRQTIRPVPKRLPALGAVESWREWKGKPYRSKHRELAVVMLTNVQIVEICEAGIRNNRGRLLPYLVALATARADGFSDWREMREWFKAQYGLPFVGVVIEAKNFTPR